MSAGFRVLNELDRHNSLEFARISLAVTELRQNRLHRCGGGRRGVTAVLLSVAAAITGGYALSRFRFKGRQIVVTTILITQLLPAVVYLLPFCTMMSTYRLLDTRLSLIISYTIFAVPIATWMMFGFMEEVPAEMDQAALVDGVSWATVVFRIITPVVAPGIVSMALFAFILGRNDYLFASVLMRTVRKWTLPIGLDSFRGAFHVDWGAIIAFSTLISVPVVVLFLLLQRGIFWPT